MNQFLGNAVLMDIGIKLPPEESSNPREERRCRAQHHSISAVCRIVGLLSTAHLKWDPTPDPHNPQNR